MMLRIIGLLKPDKLSLTLIKSGSLPVKALQEMQLLTVSGWLSMPTQQPIWDMPNLRMRSEKKL